MKVALTLIVSGPPTVFERFARAIHGCKAVFACMGMRAEHARVEYVVDDKGPALAQRGEG